MQEDWRGLPADGRQSETALMIARGVRRLLRARGFSSLTELPLTDGRRAIAALRASSSGPINPQAFCERNVPGLDEPIKDRPPCRGSSAFEAARLDRCC